MRELQWTDRTLRVRAFGPIATEAVLDAAHSVTADTRYDGLRFVVADFLDAIWSDASFLSVLEDLLAILIGASASNPNIRIAVIAQDPYIVELADALMRFTSDALPPIRTFADRASAQHWIDNQPYRSRPSLRYRPR